MLINDISKFSSVGFPLFTDLDVKAIIHDPIDIVENQKQLENDTIE